MVCGFSVGVTLGRTGGLKTCGMIEPRSPGMGGYDNAGMTPIVPSGRGGNAGRTNVAYGEG